MSLYTPLKKLLLVVRAVAEGLADELPAIADDDPRMPGAARNVLVIHGRNERARKAMFVFLRSLGLNPLEWSQARALTGKPSPYIGEILDAAFEHARAAIVLLTGDDEARLRDSLRGRGDAAEGAGLQARPNVLFEGGIAMGRAAERTIFVELGTLRPFSDISGRHVVKLTNHVKDRQDLVDRLVDARCAVNAKGVDWHSAGDFDGAIRPARRKGSPAGTAATSPRPRHQATVAAPPRPCAPSRRRSPSASRSGR